METALTSNIKARLHNFKPEMASSMRTIRWADEVCTPTGYVDTIRFEDYVEQDDSYCARISPQAKDIERLPALEGGLRQCKQPGGQFGQKRCRGCVYRRTCYTLGILVTCFEVKITVSDFKSKNGHNFHGHRNYYAVPVGIADKVLPLVPEDVGLLVYYPESGHITVRKECVRRELEEEMVSYLLYNALKKWVDGEHIGRKPPATAFI